MFLHGRTETIRSCSTDTQAFIRSMTLDVPASTRLTCLKDAIKTHSALTREAATGRGIDRHLLGLRLVMQDGESSALFDDEMFQRSQRWRLSTSGLSAGTVFRGTGFGASEPDGYGINYTADTQVIKFGIESKFSCPTTSTAKFQRALLAALRDMRNVVIDAPETQPTKNDTEKEEVQMSARL